MDEKLQIVEERIKTATVAVEAQVTHALAVLEADMTAEIKAVIIPAIQKVWSDMLADVTARLTPKPAEVAPVDESSGMAEQAEAHKRGLDK